MYQPSFPYFLFNLCSKTLYLQILDFIKPACLPTTVKQLSQTYVGENLTVTGWGRTEFDYKSDAKLKVLVCMIKISKLLYKTSFRNMYN